MKLCLSLRVMRLRLCSLLLWSVCFWSSESEAKPAPKVKCKDVNNNDVDWFILYKAPKGQRYMYISTYGKEKINTNIGDPHGVLANTLSPMFDNNMPQSFGFLSYNDQPPVSKTSDFENLKSGVYGHSKGVVLGDSQTQTALWLTHSTPRFPEKRDQQNFWPKTGEANGQTFMCVTLQFSDLEVIGEHLQNIVAHTFDDIIPANFPQEIKDAALNKGQAPDQNPLVQSLKVGNKQLKLVAKVTGQTAKDGDLYVQLSRIFKSDMEAQTWGRQTRKDKSYCEPNQHQVKSVIEVKTDLDKWTWCSDHSKWAVTTDNNIHWTCIADMNRAKTQYERPGGALCIQDQDVKGFFKVFANKLLECGVDPKNALVTAPLMWSRSLTTFRRWI
uniref:Deoxyribonuclease-2-alpha n=1 Tax=Neogobius melanostomus TaxID=47308 RepID=A0A8C6U0D9_9GOBI